MPLYIKNNEADRLARELAAATGVSLTGAIIAALRDRLATIREGSRLDVPEGEVSEIQALVGSQPPR
jgi:antitoxin VapB